MHYSFGRIPEFDDRSRGYPVKGVLYRPELVLRSKLWERPRAWDQGAYPHCVGYACVGLANTKPASNQVPQVKRWWPNNGLPKYVYREAQKVDWWPGEDYDGTSVLAGMKVLKRKRLIEEYRWCFGLKDVLKTISQHGPVVIGVNWRTSMFETDSDGFLSVSGRNEGGHAVELHGISAKGGYVIGTNSWGRDWGQEGRFKLHFEDLDRLLNEEGEAVTAIRGNRSANYLWALVNSIKGRFTK